MNDYLVKCPLCGWETDLMSLTSEELRHPTLPNTLTGLPDHNRAIWKCRHCFGWNGNDEEADANYEI